MEETNLTARGILMVALAVVVLIGAMIAAAFIVAPAHEGAAVNRQVIAVSLTLAGLALVWFIRLAVLAVGDRRRGTHREPARVGGWFHVCFGAAVAIGGIACSALTYQTAGMDGGIWTLYWGMIAWGIVQVLIGVRKLRHPDADATVQSAGISAQSPLIRH